LGSGSRRGSGEKRGGTFISPRKDHTILLAYVYRLALRRGKQVQVCGIVFNWGLTGVKPSTAVRERSARHSYVRFREFSRKSKYYGRGRHRPAEGSQKLKGVSPFSSNDKRKIKRQASLDGPPSARDLGVQISCETGVKGRFRTGGGAIGKHKGRQTRNKPKLHKKRGGGAISFMTSSGGKNVGVEGGPGDAIENRQNEKNGLKVSDFRGEVRTRRKNDICSLNDGGKEEEALTKQNS